MLDAMVYAGRMLCLLPLFIFCGVEITMWSSWFSRQMYITEVGLVFAVLGATEFVSGFFMGAISDKFGRWAVILPGQMAEEPVLPLWEASYLTPAQWIGCCSGSALFMVAMYLTKVGNQAVLKSCEKVPCDDSTAEDQDVGCVCIDADYTVNIAVFGPPSSLT